MGTETVGLAGAHLQAQGKPDVAPAAGCVAISAPSHATDFGGLAEVQGTATLFFAHVLQQLNQGYRF